MSRARGHHMHEYAYLVDCLRKDLRPGYETSGSPGYDVSRIDWSEAKVMSLVHGVYPVFVASLLAKNRQSTPDAFIREATSSLKKTLTYNTFLMQELCRVSELLKANDINVLILKGPLLAQLAYGDIRLRYSEDLDLFIRSEHYRRAHSVLCAEGYEPDGSQSRKKGFSKFLDMFFNRQASFSRGASVYRLDVHTSLMPPLFHYPVSFDEFWDRADQIPVNGSTLYTFSLEDTLQLLCFHGVKNRWNRLKYIVDIAYLVERNELDWDLVIGEAERIKAQRILLLGLYLATGLLGASIPEGIKQHIDRDQTVSRVGSAILQKFPEYTPIEETTYLERVSFNVRVQNNIRTRVRYISLSLLRRLTDTE